MSCFLIAALLWGFRMRPTATPCAELKYEVKDGHERMYFSTQEIDQRLKADDIYPVGRPLNRLSLQRIENTARSHPMIRTAECYLTPRQEVYVVLTQRVPLLRVQTPLETYFIDTDRRVMPVRASVKDSVLLVTGTVGAQTAANGLADFAEWLADNSYWRKKIHHLHLQTPQKIVIYLRGENQPRVVLGNLRHYERKLKKLRTFLENSGNILEEKQYDEIDIRYRGQVIGRYTH